MTIQRTIGAFFIFMIFLVGLLLFTEWRPDDEERELYCVEAAVDLPDTLTFVSWNIGYAGLGEGMDFFYDGGERTRASREESAQNLEAIISQLKRFEDVDFILLQEVDRSSRRSYHVDQFEAITQALSSFRYTAFALNYNSLFVPIPLADPMGGVESGVVILSKYPFFESMRRQYPSIVELPNRLFDLKRCMLSIGIATSGGDTLWVNNTHNTAFDDGEMRLREIEFIGDIISRYPHSVTAGDWNSTPPQYTPSRAALDNRYFSPLPLDEGDLPQFAQVCADISTESVRYLDAPYEPSKSTTTLVDFAILGKGYSVEKCKVLELEFKNSDHNPIKFTVFTQ